MERWLEVSRNSQEEGVEEATRNEDDVNLVRDPLNSDRRLSVPDSGDCRYVKINCTPCRNRFLPGRFKRFKRRVARSEIKCTWKFYHDNAPSHAVFVVNDFLVWTSTAVIPKRPYNSDLVAIDIFFVFSTYRNFERRRRRFRVLSKPCKSRL